MSRRLRVVTVVGTRPEIIRLSRSSSDSTSLSRRIVHTGQNHDYELSEIFFRDLGLPRPDHYLNAVGDNLARRSVISSREPTSCWSELEACGDRPVVVETVPGWTHDITNVGEGELIVLLWANEIATGGAGHVRVPAVRGMVIATCH